VPGDDKRKKPKRDKPSPPGHGRLSASDYTGATHRPCSHPSHQAGELCPLCCAGRLYPYKTKQQIQLHGHAPVSATCWDVDVLRCATCKAVFNAREPSTKYDASVKTSIVLSRYYLGLPFHRLDTFQKLVGVPLPDATQWDLAKQLFEDVFPVFVKLVEHAAQASLMYHDDTGARILSLLEENKHLSKGARYGIHSSGFVTVADHTIVLYFTGRAHAGENLDKLLDFRDEGLAKPTQMSDASSSNTAKRHLNKTQRSFCHAHAFRKFKDIVECFPDPCAVVLHSMGLVFEQDQTTKAQGLSDEQRQRYHAEHSGPLLAELKTWMLAQQHDTLTVEPNSALGQAMNYMLKRWDEFTLFLSVPGVPLDNNIVERILKRLIMQRKNSLFYANEYSAYVGCVLTSLIMTGVEAGINVFDYFNALQANRILVAREPESWLPWHYPKEQGRSPPIRPPASNRPPSAPARGDRSTAALAERAVTA